VFRPSPWDPFCTGARLACLALGLLGLHAGGWGWLGVAAGALGLLRVPRQRLLLEVAAIALLLAALVPSGLPFIILAGGALVVLLLAPESAVLTLNGMDRFFVAQDYPGCRVNCHCLIDTTAPFDRAGLEAALEAPFGVERFAAPRPWVRPAEVLIWSDTPIEARDSQLFDAPLDLQRLPPLRVVHAPRIEGGFRLCVTMHHSAADGDGQRLLVERLIRRYREHREQRAAEPLPPLAATKRYRWLLRQQGIGWMWRAIRRHFHPFRKVGAQNAHLLDDEAPQETQSHHWIARLEPDLMVRLKRAAQRAGVTRQDLLLSAALRAADALRRERGRPDRPYRVLMAVNLRPHLRVRPGVGNCVGSIQLGVEASEVRDEQLPQHLSRLIRDGTRLEEAIEAPLYLGVLSSVLPTWLLRRILRRRDADPHSFYYTFYFTLMFASPGSPFMKTPKEGPPVERVLGRTPMPRRPGFGVTLAYLREELGLFLVVEYLSPIVQDETAQAFAERFRAAIERLCDLPGKTEVADQTGSGER